MFLITFHEHKPANESVTSVMSIADSSPVLLTDMLEQRKEKE